MLLLISGLVSTTACSRPTRPLAPDALLAIAASVPALPRPPVPEKSTEKVGYIDLMFELGLLENEIYGFRAIPASILEDDIKAVETIGDTVRISLKYWGTITFVRGDTLKMELGLPGADNRGNSLRAWFLPDHSEGRFESIYTYMNKRYVSVHYQWWSDGLDRLYVVKNHSPPGGASFGPDPVTVVCLHPDGSGWARFTTSLYAWDASGHGTSPWGNW